MSDWWKSSDLPVADAIRKVATPTPPPSKKSKGGSSNRSPTGSGKPYEGTPAEEVVEEIALPVPSRPKQEVIQDDEILESNVRFIDSPTEIEEPQPGFIVPPRPSNTVYDLGTPSPIPNVPGIKDNTFLDTVAYTHGTGTPDDMGYIPKPYTESAVNEQPWTAMTGDLKPGDLFVSREPKSHKKTTWYSKPSPKVLIGSDPISGQKVYAEPSPYFKKFGYIPKDKDYATVFSDIDTSIKTTSDSISLMKENVDFAELQIPKIKESIELVENTKPGTMFSFDSDVDIDFDGVIDKEATKESLLPYLKGQLNLAENTVAMKDEIPKYEMQLTQLERTKDLVTGYKNVGYEIDLSDDGYNFSFPSATKVHSSLFGDLEPIALASASFIESPLAIKTVASGLWEWGTGDKKVGISRREELAQFSLGMKESLDKGGVDYAIKIGSSPAMVQGVILPTVTLGAGYLTQGVSTGGSGLLATTEAGKASLLSKIGTHGIDYGMKVGGYTVGAVGVGATALHLGKTYVEEPEKLPGRLAETAFTFGLAFGSFKKGQDLFKSRYPSYKMKGDSTIYGEMDVTSKPLEIKMETKSLPFKTKEGNVVEKTLMVGEGKMTFQNKKIPVKLSGVADSDPSGHWSFAEGRGTIEIPGKQPFLQIETWGGKTINIGTMKSSLKGFKWKGSAIKTGEQGKVSFFDVSGESELLAGLKGSYGFGKTGYEPTISKGKTWVEEWGKPVNDLTVQPEQITSSMMISDKESGISFTKNLISKSLPKTDMSPKIISPKHFKFAHIGKYKGNWLEGNVVQKGDIFAYQKSGSNNFLSSLDDSGGSGFGFMTSDKGGQTSSLLLESGKIIQHGDMGVTGLISKSVGKTGGITSPSGAGAGASVGGLKMDVKQDGGKILEPLSIGKQQVSFGDMSLESVMTFDNISITPKGIDIGVKPSGSIIIGGKKSGGRDSGSKVSLPKVDVGSGSKGVIGGKLTGGLNLIGRDRKKSPDTERALDIGMDFDMDFDMEQGIDIAQKVGSSQSQNMKQMQMEDITFTGFTGTAIPVPIVPHQTSKIKPVPPVIPFVFGTGGMQDKKKKKKKDFSLGNGKSKMEPVLVKSVLADPFKVQESQVSFGKATHPAPTEEIWKLGEKTGWRIPTVELMKNKNTKKGKGIFGWWK